MKQINQFRNQIFGGGKKKKAKKVQKTEGTQAVVQGSQTVSDS